MLPKFTLTDGADRKPLKSGSQYFEQRLIEGVVGLKHRKENTDKQFVQLARFMCRKSITDSITRKITKLPKK